MGDRGPAAKRAMEQISLISEAGDRGGDPSDYARSTPRGRPPSVSKSGGKASPNLDLSLERFKDSRPVLAGDPGPESRRGLSETVG
jgi:hypothetical protein